MRPEQEQELAYTLLVELLAYQFASPVRWYATIQFEFHLRLQLSSTSFPEDQGQANNCYLIRTGLKLKM